MDFATKLEGIYRKPEINDRSEVRWWMAEGMHTDETLLEELQAISDAGFRGVELCQLADHTINDSLYGYGSEQWEHDVKLILRRAKELSMTVSLTSGAGWSSSNVPGIDPDSQQTNQCIVLLCEELGGGETRTGAIPRGKNIREKATFLGSFAVRKLGENLYSEQGIVRLTEQIRDGELTWTAPEGQDYTLMYYYSQGTAHCVKPSVTPSYTVNYFDARGIEALKEYLSENVLNDEQIRETIRTGDVQLFMDSLEYTSGKGFTAWTENFAEEFRAKKGYDILPLMFLAYYAPTKSIWSWSDNEDLLGIYRLDDPIRNRQIVNDIFDLQTYLYRTNFLEPFREWLHGYGITLRAQISYGKNLEISQPIRSVDYPEAENRNQKNQIDMYRLWSGGSHLQNKILSSETGGLDQSAYAYTYARHLQEAYALYAAGYSRMVWHIWCSQYGPTPVWPGYEGGTGKEQYYKFGLREPSYSEYGEFNDHLGRIQHLLREGVGGVDLGMPYTKYGQHMAYTDKKDWLRDGEAMFFPSTSLQRHGYTYDYFNPELLTEDGVSYNATAKRLEPSGYKALVLWQDMISLKGANEVLRLAKCGLPVILLSDAATDSPYANETAQELHAILSELKALDCVATVPTAEDVLEALYDRSILPYVGLANKTSLLTQSRRIGNDLGVFVYNYGVGEGSACEELIADGTFLPYRIDAWTGKVTELATYRHENGTTAIPLTLTNGDAALFLLRAVDNAPLHVTEGADAIRENAALVLHTRETPLRATLSDGRTVIAPPCTQTAREITDWTLRVHAVVPTDRIETRTETLLGITTEEYRVATETETIDLTLPTLAPWDGIEEIGRSRSGKGYYSARFPWDGTADGACIDFGSLEQSMKVFINGKKTDDVSMIRPCADVSELLKIGENTIEIEYSSNLTNLQLSRGVIREGAVPSNFVGYDVGYLSYGPKKATLIPYRKTEIFEE